MVVIKVCTTLLIRLHRITIIKGSLVARKTDCRRLIELRALQTTQQAELLNQVQLVDLVLKESIIKLQQSPLLLTFNNQDFNNLSIQRSHLMVYPTLFNILNTRRIHSGKLLVLKDHLFNHINNHHPQLPMQESKTLDNSSKNTTQFSLLKHSELKIETIHQCKTLKGLSQSLPLMGQITIHLLVVISNQFQIKSILSVKCQIKLKYKMLVAINSIIMRIKNNMILQIIIASIQIPIYKIAALFKTKHIICSNNIITLTIKQTRVIKSTTILQLKDSNNPF